MSVIEQSRTNRVLFDASNKSHRQAARDFFKRNSWADTGLRFINVGYGSMDAYIKDELIKYYMGKEFK